LSSEPLPNSRWAMVNSISDLDLLDRQFTAATALDRAAENIRNRPDGLPGPQQRFFNSQRGR